MLIRKGSISHTMHTAKFVDRRLKIDIAFDGYFVKNSDDSEHNFAPLMFIKA